MMAAPCIERAVSLLNDHPYFGSFSLPSLTTLRLYQVLDSTDTGAGGVMMGLIEAHVHLIAALLLSGTHARQLRRLELAYHCTDATSYPTLARSSTTPPESPSELALRKLGMGNLGRLLRALKAGSTQFEDIFINSAWSSNLKALQTILFELSDSGPLGHFLQEDPSQEERRGFIASIRSVMAETFPRLHNHGLLSVKFSCPDGAADGARPAADALHFADRGAW
ncbi:hypothetical protein OH76DRAFT_933847 [Lentinus brumalis]|uniref:Uncharacterized protein n=1 Tax=Lentinus brumalis TaxID=2498619 RepID=A0A371CZT6_9APHY|nr:hypothetical protein OH76DRAFT_933847 [Polyporus brumalis]